MKSHKREGTLVEMAAIDLRLLKKDDIQKIRVADDRSCNPGILFRGKASRIKEKVP